MIYVGNDKIYGIKLGSDEIPAIYCGETRIYPFKQPFTYATFTSNAAQTVSFSQGTFDYSYDNIHWKEASSSIQFGTSGKETVYVAGNNDSVGTAVFGTSAPVSVGGVANGLINCDKEDTSTLSGKTLESLFSNATVITAVDNGFLPATAITKYCYYEMFQGCTGLTSAPALPATALTETCYYGMFKNCTSLTTTPELPATTLADNCYNNMFNGCTSLTTATELPATTLFSSCYYSMFKNCTSLTTTPELPATELKDSCYMSMFQGCTKLKYAQPLPATTLANTCYTYMFSGCVSLVTVLELPATNLTNNCYNYMFADCISLTSTPNLTSTNLASYCYAYMFYGCNGLYTFTELPSTSLENGCYEGMFMGCDSMQVAPALPATSLAPNCYSSMFKNCTELITAPELPATTLVTKCYSNMFNGCKYLDEIHVKANSGVTSANTNNWLYGVASTGNFYGSSNVGWIIDSPNGVPVGWTMMPTKWITFTASASQSVKTSIAKSFRYSYDGIHWNDWTTSTSYLSFGTSGKNTLYIAGKNNTTLSTSSTSLTFVFSSSTAAVTVGGNAMALFDGANTPTALKDYCFKGMFSGATALKTVESGFLSATALASYCYQNMFRGCTSLTTAPTLTATALASYCYQNMFYGCTSLTTAPTLPATALSTYCYDNMFYGCTSLTTAPALPSKTMVAKCYNSMFYNCTALTSAPALPATTLAEGCYCNMFCNCKSLVSSPALPAKTLTTNCYQYMFYGCTKLNYVSCSASTASTAYTGSWLWNVASAGTFNGGSTSWSRDANGIPSGWTIAPKVSTTFSASSTQSVTFSQGSYLYSYDNKYWSAATLPISFGTSGKKKVYVAGNNSSAGTATFNSTAAVAVGGVVNGLVNCNSTNTKTLNSKNFRELFKGATALKTVESGFLPATALTTFCYYYLFYGCTGLTSAPNLPATTLSANCYDYMFYNCKSLTTAPVISATTSAEYCCRAMFCNCTSLTTAPTLSAATLTKQCYYYMFYGCTKLNYVNCLATSISASDCTTGWLGSVASTGNFYGKTAAGWTTGDKGIPSGWTKHLS